MSPATITVVHVLRGDAMPERPLSPLLRALSTHGDIQCHPILIGHGTTEESLRTEGIPLEVIKTDRQSPWQLLMKLRRRIRALTPHIIHSHPSTHCLTTLAALGRGAVSVRTIERRLTRADEKGRLPRCIDHLCSRFQEAGICADEGTAASARIQMPGLFIQVIDDALDLSALRSAASRCIEGTLLGPPLRVAFAGALTATHRPDVFVATAHILSRERPGLFSFHLIGTGPLQNECDRFIHRHTLREHVRIHSGKENFHALLARMDAIVIMTDDEGLSSNLPEAMILGIPIVAHATGTISRLLDYGKGGHLVRTHEPRAYAEALLKIANEPDEASARAQRARRVGETRFSPTLAAERHVELYRSLLSVPSRTRRIVYD